MRRFALSILALLMAVTLGAPPLQAEEAKDQAALAKALAATGGQGAIVTEHAYHGVTTAIADLSPEEWPSGHRPANVETIAPPGTEGPDMQAALERLQVPLAATFLDGAFTSDGIRFPPPETTELQSGTDLKLHPAATFRTRV